MYPRRKEVIKYKVMYSNRKNMLKNSTGSENERGMVMLEALIVYTITIFLLFFLLALFSVFYHIWNIQTIANEAAMRIAQTYKYRDADADTGYVTIDQISGLEKYRYFVGAQHSAETSAKSKIQDYINDRLDHTSFVNKVAEPEIYFEVKQDALSNRHVEVTVMQKFVVPFGDALTYFGYDNMIQYEVTAYAECLDIIDYINMVDFVGQQTTLGSLGSNTVKMVNSILKLFNHIAGLLN